MKKIIYVLIMLVVISASFTACTKEEVKPQTGSTSGGGEIRE